MKNPLILLFLVIFSASNSFAQSKKEQIEQLNYRVDSLIRVLSSERTTIKQQKASLEQQIVNLNSSITNLNAQATRDNNFIKSKELELSKVSSSLSSLTSLLKVKSDSLNLVLADLVKLKPPVKIAPVTVVVDNKGPIKGVAIGTQVWMSTNLNVSTYRNGDVIPQVQDKDAWANLTTGAWCYYENDAKNGVKYGKLYNWFAVNDARGLAPAGWHIPTDGEWTVLENSLGDDAGKKMKSASGWTPLEIACANCESWNEEYRRKKECNVCKDTRLVFGKTNSGNGSNSSGFLGLPGGCRYYSGYFSFVGNYGYWWSASEYNEAKAWDRELLTSNSDLNRSSANKGYGFSVRCVRD